MKSLIVCESTQVSLAVLSLNSWSTISHIIWATGVLPWYHSWLQTLHRKHMNWSNPLRMGSTIAASWCPAGGSTEWKVQLCCSKALQDLIVAPCVTYIHQTSSSSRRTSSSVSSTSELNYLHNVLPLTCVCTDSSWTLCPHICGGWHATPIFSRGMNSQSSLFLNSPDWISQQLLPCQSMCHC